MYWLSFGVDGAEVMPALGYSVGSYSEKRLLHETRMRAIDVARRTGKKSVAILRRDGVEVGRFYGFA